MTDHLAFRFCNRFFNNLALQPGAAPEHVQLDLGLDEKMDAVLFTGLAPYRVRHLTLAFRVGCRKHHLEMLTDMPHVAHLHTLAFHEADASSSLPYHLLRRCTRLEEFHLQTDMEIPNSLPPSLAAVLCEMSHLRSFETDVLSGTKFAALPVTLEKLIVDRLQGQTEKCTSHLTRMTRLSHFVCGETNWRVDDVVRVLPALTTLRLDDCQMPLTPLTLETLRTVRCSGVLTSQWGALYRRFLSLPNLESLNINIYYRQYSLRAGSFLVDALRDTVAETSRPLRLRDLWINESVNDTNLADLASCAGPPGTAVS